jgi:hypothetical protein
MQINKRMAWEQIIRLKKLRDLVSELKTEATASVFLWALFV